MRKFDTILFDVDGTLLDFKKTEREALSMTLIQLDILPTEENIKEYVSVNSRLWDMLEKGMIKKDLLKTERFRQFFENIHVNADELAASDAYIDNLSKSFFLIDGAMELCGMRSREYKIAVSTNGIAKVQHSRLKLSGLKEHFEYVYISDEIGHPKPHKEFFDYIFKDMKVRDLNRVIILGDSLTSDIKGGNNAGIATCWYNPDNLNNNTDSVCDYIIKSLDEFEALITGK